MSMKYLQIQPQSLYPIISPDYCNLLNAQWKAQKKLYLFLK